MNTYHKIAERTWLVIAIVTFIVAVYEIGKHGIQESLMYLLFPVVALALFYMRYFLRKRMESREDKSE